MTAGPRALAGALVAAVVLLAPAPAVAAPAGETIPPQVTAFLHGEALRALPRDAANGPVRPTHVHQVFGFTRNFLAGRATDEPVAARDEWLAVLERAGGSVVGTVRVYRDDGGPVRLAGLGLADGDTAAALAGLAAGEVLIEEPTSGSFYGLRGTTVRPLSRWARDEFPSSGTLADLQQVIADRVARDARLEAAMTARESRLQLLAVVGLLGFLAVAGLGLLALDRRAGRAGQADAQSGSTHHTPTGA